MTQHRRSFSSPDEITLPKPVIPATFQEEESFRDPGTPQNGDTTDDSLFLEPSTPDNSSFTEDPLFDSPISNSLSFDFSPGVSEEGSPFSEQNCVNITEILKKQSKGLKTFGVFSPPILGKNGIAFTMRHQNQSDAFLGKERKDTSMFPSKDDMFTTPKKPIKDTLVTDSGRRFGVFNKPGTMFPIHFVLEEVEQADADKGNTVSTAPTPYTPNF